MNVVLFIAIGVPGLLLLLFIGLLLYRQYLRYSTKIETPNGISSLGEITLGGVKQWIFIRGLDQNNPVLLFLHGGPGEPAMGMSNSRRSDAELIRHFTVVHWDQRGAGKSFDVSIPAESMTLDRLIEDCSELIDHLRSRFDTPRVFLVGHSSGTLVGIKTAHRYPGKIHAYVGVAQITSDYEQQRVSYEFVLEEAVKSGNLKHQEAIKAIGPPPYETPKKEYQKADFIIRYGGMMVKFSFRRMIGLILPYLTSPEYSLSEGIRTILGRGRDFTTYALWKEIVDVDFTKEIDSMRVPIYFIEGKYDMIAPTILVEDFYDSLVAEKSKKLVIFEESGHWPMIEEKKRYVDILVNTVLKECLVD